MKDNRSGKIKVMVVDDHPIVRQGLAQVINGEKDLVMDCEAGDIQEAMACFRKSKPDFAVIDISLKGGSGLELTKSLLAIAPKLPVLIISMHDESLYGERVLRCGAKGYLMKQEAAEKVVGAIRKILDGEIYVSERMNELILNKVASGKSLADGVSVENLSDRELEILQLVGQGRGTRQISEDLHVSVKTVESHYANIKDKLNLKTVNELIQYAVKWHHSES